MNIRLFNEYDILYPSCNFLTCMVCFARDVLKLKEAIRIKEAEGDAYISDIEVSSFFFFLISSLCCVYACVEAYDIVTADNWSSV